MLLDYLRSEKAKRLASQKSGKEQRTELTARRKRQVRYQENFVRAVRDSGGSPALYANLAKVGAEIARIDEILQSTMAQPVREVPPKKCVGSSTSGWTGSPQALSAFSIASANSG
jgi:hypothetical protein